MTSTDLRRPTAGVGLLTGFAARRERVRTPLAVVALPVLVGVTGAAMASLYPDAAAREALRSGAADNPAFRLLLGPLGGDTSAAAITTWRVGLFLALVAGILVALTVIRNSRAEEDAGRGELVRAGAVAPTAPMLVAAAVATTVGVALGIVTACATAVVGASAASAVMVGVGYVTVTAAAVGVAAIADQVFATARAAGVAAVTVLAGGYVLRGVGDLVDGFTWLRWVSPVGWVELIDPFGQRRVLPVVAGVTVGVVGVAVAAAVARRRDLGEGLLVRRAGPAGSRRLRGAGALEARVSAPTIAPWVSATAAYCLLLGFLLSSVGDLVPSSGGVTDIVRDLGGGGALAEAVMTAVLGFVGVIAGLAGVAVVVRARADETAGRTEQILATATSRSRLFLSTAAAALGASVAVIVAASVAVAVAHAAGAGTSAVPDIGTVLGAGAVQIPGTLLVVAVGVAAYGCRPRFVAAGWAAVLGDMLLAQFGELFSLPSWVRDLAPHTHVSGMTPGHVGLTAPIVSLVVAAALLGLGWWGFGRRDIVGAGGG
ncbi:ABC transporter permease [Williamsia sp. MIQD14]|uniref:ABC transporter permease n=1 Tax=Williamsia sp. MIQD14 TaxID=3425703 RepID=UPI003DA1BBD9